MAPDNCPVHGVSSKLIGGREAGDPRLESDTTDAMPSTNAHRRVNGACGLGCAMDGKQ